jgi:transposase
VGFLLQDFPNWIECHILAFEFFQGTSQLVVPDYQRTGVSRVCPYRKLNPIFRGFASGSM